MLFSEIPFFVFFLVYLTLHLLLPASLRLYLIIVGSTVFYAWWRPLNVLIIAPSAIIKGTKHLNSAKLFMEYLDSIEAAKINAKHFAIPLRPEVPSPPGAKPISEIKTIRPSVAEIDKGIPDVIEQWRDTFGN